MVDFDEYKIVDIKWYKYDHWSMLLIMLMLSMFEYIAWRRQTHLKFTFASLSFPMVQSNISSLQQETVESNTFNLISYTFLNNKKLK